MKKNKLFVLLRSICLGILLFFFTTRNVNAIYIDTSRTARINIEYCFADKFFSDAGVYLYKIADMNADAKFTYTSAFATQTKDVNTMIASEWTNFAKELDKYIVDNNVEPLVTGKTDANGRVNFGQLTLGLYLLKVDSVTVNDYKYSSTPSLISLPNYNQMQNYYMYDVNLVTKTEAKFIGIIDDGSGKDDNKIESPNTFDPIVIYVAVLIISIIVLVCSVCYINKKRKGCIKNEKEND